VGLYSITLFKIEVRPAEDENGRDRDVDAMADNRAAVLGVSGSTRRATALYPPWKRSSGKRGACRWRDKKWTELNGSFDSFNSARVKTQ
jgi:hypothetical protein